MNIYLLAKKIHRLLILFVTILGLAMVSTGLMMKYPVLFDWFLLDPGTIRWIHSTLSTYFAIVLLSMMVTGLAMYFVLKARRSSQSKSPPGT